MPTASSPLPELISFLDTLPEPHILCDRSYRIIAANPAYQASYGDGNSLIGRRCHEISHRYGTPCDRVGVACPLAACLLSKQRERVLHLHHTPRGKEYVNIELSPVRNARGEIAWFVEKMETLPVARGVAAPTGLIGKAPNFRRMLELVARAAPSEAAVLLQGESGTGKELVAQAVHSASRRADKPFIVVDCSGLPETLVESELFGYERGAFTGAAAAKLGLVEIANGGTLFLDEVGDIPPGMQVKLLRLLETGTYRRIGSTELRHTDIRLVSATLRPLQRMSAAGSFRQDLYHRINTFPITVPPLRERLDDLPLLVTALLERIAPGRALALSAAAAQALAAYPFPGNIRELRNLLERASLMCDGNIIEPEHFQEEELAYSDLDNAKRIQPLADTAHDLEEIQRQALQQIVKEHPGSRRELARKLGISERTLYRRLQTLRTKSSATD